MEAGYTYKKRRLFFQQHTLKHLIADAERCQVEDNPILSVEEIKELNTKLERIVNEFKV